jgi:two-component system, OmpR family, phosphate regulon sensor histidine kinase PhoR
MSTGDYLLLALVIILTASLGWAVARMRAALVESSMATRSRLDAVAARSALEAQLAEERNHLAALGEADPQAMLLLGGNRQILWGNEAAWKMFGGGERVIGQPFISLVQDFELNQAVMDAESGRRPIARQAAVGGRTLRIQAMPIEDADGAAIVIEDVTELQRLGRARRDFVANLSHELRTPLANIDLAAQTLRGGGAADPIMAQRMLDQIDHQVHTLSQLSQEMLDLA